MDNKSKRGSMAGSNGEKTTAGGKTRKQAAVDDTLRTIDIDGLKMIFLAKSRCLKIMWITILLVLICVFIWQLYMVITQYLQSPIVSTYTIAPVDSMRFPILYICPTSLASFPFLNKTPDGEQTVLELKQEMRSVWDYVNFLANGNLSDAGPSVSEDLINYVLPGAFRPVNDGQDHTDRPRATGVAATVDAQQFFQNATVDLDNIIRYCEFRELFFDILPCRNITSEVLHPQNGKCYQVDVGSRMQMTPSQALLVVLNARTIWYPKSQALSPLFNGFHLSIHNSRTVPGSGSGESLLLTPGKYYRVDLATQRQEFQNYTRPTVQTCSTRDTFDLFNVSYTQQICQIDCSAREIRDVCGCIPPVDRSFFRADAQQTPFCKMSHLDCIRQDVHGNQTALDRIAACRQNCLVPCEDWRYTVTSSSMDLYKPSFAPEQPMPDIIYLLVSFSQMEYTQYTQDEQTSFDEFVSSIGGVADLWLGAGLLALIQMPLFLGAICCNAVHKRKAKQEEEEE